jgi:hypothetical protein
MVMTAVPSPSDGIVTLDEAKAYIGQTSANPTIDAKIRRTLGAVSDVVENIVGPVRPKDFVEWHEGGSARILLERRPVLEITDVVEYQGTVSQALTNQSPDAAGALDAFGYFAYLDEGIVERTAYGVPTWFSALPWWSSTSPGWLVASTARLGYGNGRVKVTYTAGRRTIADHIVEGTLELLRVNYQETQQGGRPRYRNSGGMDDEPGTFVMGYYVPNRVRELLGPSWQSRGLT